MYPSESKGSFNIATYMQVQAIDAQAVAMTLGEGRGVRFHLATATFLLQLATYSNSQGS